MICQVCKDEGTQSTVSEGSTSETLVAYPRFYDGSGKLHDHDDNCQITYFQCSAGHSFSYRPQRTCWCGWKGKEDCFCHPLGFKLRI